MTPAYKAIAAVEVSRPRCDELHWAIDEAWKIQSWSLV